MGNFSSAVLMNCLFKPSSHGKFFVAKDEDYYLSCANLQSTHSVHWLLQKHKLNGMELAGTYSREGFFEGGNSRI